MMTLNLNSIPHAITGAWFNPYVFINLIIDHFISAALFNYIVDLTVNEIIIHPVAGKMRRGMVTRQYYEHQHQLEEGHMILGPSAIICHLQLL
jgi:hypothetical protein